MGIKCQGELEDRLAWLAPSCSSVCFCVTVVLLADKVGTMAAWPISAIEEMHLVIVNNDSATYHYINRSFQPLRVPINTEVMI